MVITDFSRASLYHYIFKTQKKMEKLSPLECQTAFQHWVAYIRANSPDVSLKERFMCPLLGCAKSYDDLAATLNHVAGCPSLDAAEYWCPSCRRSERFPGYSPPQIFHSHNTLQRTGSKLKRAVVFFRHLSLRSCSRSRTHEPPASARRSSHVAFPLDTKDSLPSSPNAAPSYLVHLNDINGMNSKSELDSTPSAGLHSQRAELSSRPTVRAQGPRKAPSSFFSELSAVQSRSLPRDHESFADNSAPVHRYGPDDYDLVSPQDDGFARTAETMCISFPLDVKHLPPTPPRSQSSSQQSSPVDGLGGWPSELESPVTGQFAHFHALSELAADPLTPGASTTGPATPSRHTGIGSTEQMMAEDIPERAQVEELHHLFKVLHREWLSRLSVMPDLLLPCSRLPVDKLLEKGLQTLQNFLMGTLPGTFEATFAMMLVAVACAFMLYEDRDLSSWYDLLQDVMHWRHGISDATEKKLFVRVMVQVAPCTRAPPMSPFLGQTASRPCGAVRPSGQSASRRPDTYENARALHGIATAPVEVPYGIDPLLWRLGKGKAIGACLEFLDGISYTGVMERSMHYLATAPWYIQQHLGNVEDMDRSIIGQLMLQIPMQAFRHELGEVSISLRGGLLRSPREIEVSLLSRCKSFNNNPSTYSRCHQAITSVCDHMMESEGPRWRYPHHAAEIDKVLAIAIKHSVDFHAIELPSYEEINIHSPSANETDSPATPPILMASPTASPSVSEGSEHSFPTALHCPISPPPHYTEDDVHMLDTPTSTTPSSFSTTSSPASSLSPTFPLSPVKASRCPYCDRHFTTTNIRRHIRNIHHREESLRCREPNCKSTFSRQDNVDKHMRKVHGEVPLARQGAVRRRKVSV